MCNLAIRIALEEDPRNRFELITSSYHRLKSYGLHSHYILSACEIAHSVYKNNNRKSDPYIKRAFIKLDSQSYVFDNRKLRIPTKPRHFIHIAVEDSDYHRSVLDGLSLKRGSVTLTDRAVCIALSKETATIKPLGKLGIDTNERNVTWSDSQNNTKRLDTSEIAEIKARYRSLRAKIAKRTQKDMRVQRKLLNKYGRRERYRTMQRLHIISKTVVEHAKREQLCIVMERLKGIRRLYRKGNGQGTLFRGRMNTWTFHEIQRQIEYKASWEGIAVVYVNPRGTSRNCSCGSRVIELDNRQVWCPNCDKIWDRDVLASKNIMARMVLRARPSRGRSEKEPKPKEETVILRPDERKLAYPTTS